MNNYKHKFAFTLAEVLVTLGIIGVVAVLTVPNIISSYQQKVLDTQAKKVENELSNAFALLIAEEEVESLLDSSIFVKTINQDSVEKSVEMFLDKYIKTSKKCGYTSDQTTCTKGTFIYVDDNNQIYDFPGIESYCANLKMGATICIKPFTDLSHALVYVDLNNLKSPNKSGVDVLFYGVAPDATLFKVAYIYVPEGTNVSVDAVLVSYTGDSKIEVIKLLRETNRLGLADAKAMAESIPVVIKSGVTLEECLSYKESFVNVGASFECSINE